MANRSAKSNIIRPKLITLAVASCFAASGAWANPTGPSVANGTVHFTGLNTSSLQVDTTTSKAVINWQGFSIDPGETTRFQQPDTSSAVLNRVTTLNNPSFINGVLSSNGQVFLINPSGIAIGPSGSINVAAFVASSLNLSDSDFLSGRLCFTANSGAGAIENYGTITTSIPEQPSGGHVYLVGPAVTNGKTGAIKGVITTPGGETILAAGNSVELVDPGTPNVAVKIDAPDNQALNLGTIMAAAGRVGIFAGLIDQRGTVSADAAMVTDDGKIVFRATKGVTIASGSSTSADSAAGAIDIAAGDVTVSAPVYSYAQSISASGDVTVAADPGGIADLSAYGPQKIQAGGTVRVQDAGAGSSALIEGWGQTINADSVAVASTGGFSTIANYGSDAQSIGAAHNVALTAAAPNSLASISSMTTQSIHAGGNLAVEAAGPGSQATVQGSGQTIETESIGVASNGGQVAQIINVGSGAQTIRTEGMNAAGEGLAVRSSGGSATIQQAVPGGQQTIDVRNADRVVVDGVAGLASISAFSATQNISITGDTSRNALVLGSPVSSGASIIGDGGGAQSVIAGLPGQNGSIDIYGNTSGGLNRTFISYFTGLPDPGNTQSVSTAGTLTVIGGAGSHGNNNSGVFANAPGGVQRVGAQAIALQGGGDGTPGGGNGAMIGANAGAQTIDVGAGGITEHGGGANSQALIYQRDSAPSQTINVGGSILLQGGAGSGGFAGISAPVQLVNVDGDVTLVGGSVPNTGVRIGGFGANNPDLTTNLTLNVGGDVMLLGGNGSVAGEALGGSAAGGQPAEVTVHAGGDITLEPGLAGASARIGTSPLNTAGGDILLDAHGNIALDSAGPGAGTFISTLADVTLHARSISEGADSSIIARALSASARHGIDLPGTNRVSQFDADTFLSGGITFNNTSPVLNVTGIDAFPFGAVNLTQTGGLLVTGNMLAGRQNIAATGDITVGPAPGAPGVSVFALGPQSITAGGALRLQGGDADNGYVEVGSFGRLSVATGGDLSLAGGSGQYAHALLWSLGRMDLSVAGTTTLTDGSGQFAWARIAGPGRGH